MKKTRKKHSSSSKNEHKLRGSLLVLCISVTQTLYLLARCTKIQTLCYFLYIQMSFIFKNIIQAFTVYYNKWVYGTADSLYRKWRNIFVFDLCYKPATAKREEKEVDGLGGHTLISSWISPVDLIPYRVTCRLQTHRTLLLWAKLRDDPVTVETGAPLWLPGSHYV